MHSLCWRLSATFPPSVLACNRFSHYDTWPTPTQQTVLHIQYNIMTTQIRDTQFGHLVRYLSGKKLLRYPDEVDLSLCRKPFLSRSQDQQRDNVGPSDDSNDIDGADADGSDTETQDVEKADKRRAAAVDEAMFLVDWYGPDDPEVPIVLRNP